MSNPSKPRPQCGVTLIELLSVMAIVSITVGITGPSFNSMRQRAKLAGTAAQVETDLQFARSQAVAVNRTVRFDLHEGQQGTCYVIHTGPTESCTCSGSSAASCDAPADLMRSVSWDQGSEVQVRSATRSIAFDPTRGTVTPTATVRTETAGGKAIHQVINLMGRVRSCSPQGQVSGELTC